MSKNSKIYKGVRPTPKDEEEIRRQLTKQKLAKIPLRLVPESLPEQTESQGAPSSEPAQTKTQSETQTPAHAQNQIPPQTQSQNQTQAPTPNPIPAANQQHDPHASEQVTSTNPLLGIPTSSSDYSPLGLDPLSPSENEEATLALLQPGNPSKNNKGGG